jgi:trigger factor
MNITKTRQDDLNAIIKIQLEKEDYASRVENTLKDYQRKAVIDGFRKGKTPMGIVKKMYGKAI